MPIKTGYRPGPSPSDSREGGGKGTKVAEGTNRNHQYGGNHMPGGLKSRNAAKDGGGKTSSGGSMHHGELGGPQPMGWGGLAEKAERVSRKKARV